jgi:hypothetical protein
MPAFLQIQVVPALRIPGFTNFTSRQAVLPCVCVYAFRQTDSNVRCAVSCHADAVKSDCTILLRNISNLLTPLNSLCSQNERAIYMPLTYATICAKALSRFKMLKKEKRRRLRRNFFCKQWVVWSVQNRAGWHNISWKQTTITASLQKGTATSSASNERGAAFKKCWTIEGGLCGETFNGCRIFIHWGEWLNSF